jgi:hypothetical protein
MTMHHRARGNKPRNNHDGTFADIATIGVAGSWSAGAGSPTAIATAT